MPKFLKIEVTVPLPDGVVAASKAIGDADDRMCIIAKEFPDGSVSWSFVTTKPRVGTGAGGEPNTNQGGE